MSTIPEQYRGAGYGTIYGDAELRQAIANAEIAKLFGSDGGSSENGGEVTVLGDTTTTPIVTSGSGDKIIIPAGIKKIKVYSLYFVASGNTGIILKSGSQAISGTMPLLSFASDFTAPITTPTNTAFVVNVQAEVTLNGFVVWRAE